eukprot:scaffold153783_cov35-Tisochrysis_lutea.AAC.2
MGSRANDDGQPCRAIEGWLAERQVKLRWQSAVRGATTENISFCQHIVTSCDSDSRIEREGRRGRRANEQRACGAVGCGANGKPRASQRPSTG